jgi:anaerobic magnesium-protoporphyrin IX monomethyl ester cyclase
MKTKIYLLWAPAASTKGVIGLMFPPLGILYIAAYLRAKLDTVNIKVGDAYQIGRQKALQDVLEFEPDILGVSFGTQSSTGAYSFINEIKKAGSKAIVVAGGPHPSAMPEEVFKRSETDLVVIGEGEETFLEITRRFQAGRSLSGILGTAERHESEFVLNERRPVIRNLDEIPYPARDLVDVMAYPGNYYKKQRLDTSIISSRGCPYNCTFCANGVWNKADIRYRLRSPQNVVDEIEFIRDNYGIYEIFDQTDDFNISLKWAKELCDELIRRNLGVSLKVMVRADNIDEELAEKMVKAGFWVALVGVESISQNTLLGIRKKLDFSKVNQAIAVLNKYRLKVFLLLMTFNVWEENGQLRYETKTEALATLKWVKGMVKKNWVHLITWSLTTPFPGSELYHIALKHDLILPEIKGKWENWDPSSTFVMKLPGVTQNDWLDIKNKGAILQAILLFRSKAFNLSSALLYFQRFNSFVRRFLSSKIRKIVEAVNIFA